jgi:hypothetical protein
MRVIVITRHAISNYGSILQTIATQQSIEKLGHECKILDYIREDELLKNSMRTDLAKKAKWNKNYATRALYKIIRLPENKCMDIRFSSMRKKYLKLTGWYKSLEDLKSVPDADVYLTGSDQVWGPVQMGGYDGRYFLDFVQDDKKKVSYAASFGKTDITEETKDFFYRLLLRYDKITVREKTAVNIIDNLNLEAEQVLDPTLLLEASEWMKLIRKLPKKRYVLVYAIHNNRRLDQYAKEFAKKAGLPLVRITPLIHQLMRGGKIIWLPDIGKFLSYIKNATFLITDSFHGTAFAINFGTQFVEVLPNNGTDSRNMSILELTGLKDRVVIDTNDFSYIEKEIDYKPVNAIIDLERKKSIEILGRMIQE